jgi:hypothetical protein
MTWFIGRRHSKKRIWLIGLVPVLALLGYTFFQHHRHAASGAADRTDPLPLQGGVLAKGLRIEEHIEGQKAFSIEIDRIRIVGKKAAFLRLGFWRVASLENVRISLYERDMQAGGPDYARVHAAGGAPESVFGRTADSTRAAPGLGDLFFKNNRLRRMMPKGVKGIEMHDVEISVFDGGKVASVLSSDDACVDARGKAVIFEGRVKMASQQGVVLESQEMIWSADTNTLKTKGLFELKASERIVRGEGLETDFRLEHIVNTGRSVG